MKLLLINGGSRLPFLEKTRGTKRRSRFPTTPALYWNPAGSFQAELLNCGSSPYLAMSSTYWDSAERVKIVSNVSKHFPSLVGAR